MAVEIERKFLVASDEWRTHPATYYCQGYLTRERARTVRVRVAGEKAWLTVKGLNVGTTRDEFEYEIPVADAKAMLKLCEQPLIEKYRREIPFGGMTWDVDEFLGLNAGLVVAEIELESEDQPFENPAWLGKEVSDDARYFNSRLSQTPYSTWQENQ